MTAAATADGGWHHYGLTYDGARWNLYVDGGLVLDGADALDTAAAIDFQVGRGWRPSDYYFEGAVDDLRLIAGVRDGAESTRGPRRPTTVHFGTDGGREGSLPRRHLGAERAEPTSLARPP